MTTVISVDITVESKTWTIRRENSDIVLRNSGRVNPVKCSVNESMAKICTAFALEMFADLVFRGIDSNTNMDWGRNRDVDRLIKVVTMLIEQ